MLTAAQAHYRRQKQLSDQAAARATRLWALGLAPRSLDASAHALNNGLLRIVIAAQLAAAATADPYADEVLAEQGLSAERTASVVATSYAGVASDGRPLRTLLLEPLYAIKTALGAGSTMPDAFTRGLTSLSRIVSTQITDAGRVATGTALVARPSVDGYVRQLSPPSCSRCAVLAGKFYRWNTGFQRHPHCDCINVPTTGQRSRDLVTDPSLAFQAGQVTGLSAADTRAITDGADLAKVVNAHRGMSTADVYGHTLSVTSEGTAALTARAPRLMPESIYAVAGENRDEALRLLRHFGYLQ